MVEKLRIEEAPSDIGALGRYILTFEIFDYLKNLKPGYGREIQLTDAIRDMAREKDVYGMLYRGTRYDIGNKLEWLKANVELALKDEELGEKFKKWLMSIEII